MRRQPSFDEQVYRMGLVWPELTLRRRVRQVEAVWIGELRPSPMSANYCVRVQFRPQWRPEVRVLAPQLEIREGASCLPHVNDDGSLCLHVQGEWQNWMYLADYFIPWISSWLYFYEVWYATGFWVGGGTHPGKLEHRSE
jgi:hypothetical protein